MDMRGIANQKHDGPAEADEEPVCNGRTIPEAGGPNSGGDVYGLWIHRRVRGEEARTELIEKVLNVSGRRVRGRRAHRIGNTTRDTVYLV